MLDSLEPNATSPGISPPKDPLLQPLTIRHLTLRNRIMSTSHACGLEVGATFAEREGIASRTVGDAAGDRAAAVAETAPGQ